MSSNSKGIGLRSAVGIAVGVVCVLSFLNATGNLLPRSDTEEPSPPAGPDSSGRAGRKLPTAVLFGDSITQEGSDPAMQGWVSALTAYWVRRVDVVNRGFGGYTSRWGLQLFDSVVLARRPEVIFLFFGANDAVVPAHMQHVPLREYAANLQAMVRSGLDSGARVVLITPPPVYEPVLEQRNREKGKALLTDRLAPNTLRYVEACKEVAAQFSVPVPVVDAFAALGGLSEERGSFLRDGLHLNAAGNAALFKAVQAVLQQQLPQLLPDALPLYQPHWSEIIADPSVL